jgi:hypothetical protein
MEIIRGLAIGLAMLLPMASSAGAQALDKKVLSFAAAQRIAAVAADAARAKGVLGAFADPKLGLVEFDDRIHRIYIVNGSALVEINQRFHGWGRDHYYRDFWMFARRDGRWWLVRYDYEPQPPFDTRR